MADRQAKAAARRGGDPAAEPVLLSGGNPQIPKGEGEGPVAAWIAAAPGWKGDLARELDALIVRSVPEVKKAVKWNSPFYGIDGQGWFLSCHCFERYLKLTFFSGSSLDPVPPVASKHPRVRYAHIHEGDIMDAAQLEDWVRQASRLPGETL